MSTDGILMVNLGSPDSPSTPDVRRYLREFLMDPRVLDAPWPIRAFVVYGLILPRRPQQSAEAYRKIWLPNGSPLVVLGKRVREEMEKRLAVPVELAMRYQQPSIPDALARLVRRRAQRLTVVPLFPHYAMSSYESAVVRVQEAAARHTPRLPLRFVPPFFAEPDYIGALVESAQPYLEQPHDYVLFSFHGLPERHLRKSDPTRGHCLRTPDCCRQASTAHATCYRHQCFRTVEEFVRRTSIPQSRYSIAFQSRLGRDPWLTPATDQVLPQLARDGHRRILVLCPAFVADCLETLEEIGIRGREAFREAGGEELILVPCVNDHPAWLNALERMIRQTVTSSRPGAPDDTPALRAEH